jgi:hypothetical protein
MGALVIIAVFVGLVLTLHRKKHPKKFDDD